MSDYELLKTAIDAVIKANGRAEITGSIMNQTLTAMVNSLGRGYQFIGVATPEINPNTPDEKVFYLAMQAGTYTNFGNITLNTGLTVLTWDGEWHSLTVFRTDTTPTLNSADLITSGAVYNAIKNDGGAYDVSAHFQTGGEGGGNTYTLANAIAKVPVNMRKGGMSIKFVDATTNKYVKHTFLNPTTDGFTNVNNWQGIIESAAGFHTIGSAKNHQLASVGALVEEFGIKTVNELPTASASTMNKIYSIPTAHPVAGKRRDEYFTVETGISPDYTDVKDLVTVTAIPDNALGAQVGEGKFIANDTTNNKAYYFVSVHAENEWGYEVTVEEVASGKVARMRDESQYASNGTAWVADYHYADYTWESLSPDLSSLATKSEVAEVAHALELTALDCENMTSIEYADLVELRDDGELIPGKWYRIVDYHTTTAQENTQSADHQFDVIVRADAVDKLNENAFAAISHGDTYFTNAGAKLETWELKYRLDNDTDRFAWADDTNGKGVIYWMRDEWGNECPYDFKNIQFKRYKITECTKSPNLVGRYAALDAQNVVLDDTADWCFTFCVLDFNDNKAHDVSTEQKRYPSDEGFAYKTKNNRIGFKVVGDYENEPVTEKMFLPDNVFVTNTDLINAEYEGGEVRYSEFYGYYSNTFGDVCYSNTFGNNNYRNAFGNNCFANTFGDYCNSNTTSNDCYYNTFGNNCYQNMFGNNCFANTFGDYCDLNMFGNNCYQNTFGDYCFSNTFFDECYLNTFGIYCRHNTFGNYCHLIKFGTSSTIKNYYENIIVENGNCNIYLNCSAMTSPSSYFRNVKIAQGVNNIDTYKTITHSTTNDAFQTIYKAQGSQEIEV